MSSDEYETDGDDIQFQNKSRSESPINSITKANLFKKYSFVADKSPKRMKGSIKKTKNEISTKKNNQDDEEYRLSTHEIEKMKLIFDEFLQNKIKKQNRVENEWTEKLYENKQYVNRVQNIVSKTNQRISLKHVTKEAKFEKKFDVFKQLGTFIEINDILQKLTNIEGIDNLPQEQIIQLIDQQKIIKNNDNESKQIKSYKQDLLERAKHKIKQYESKLNQKKKSKENNQKELDPELQNFLQNELEQQIEINQRRMLGLEDGIDLQSVKIDRQIVELIKDQDTQNQYELIMKQQHEQDELIKQHNKITTTNSQSDQQQSALVQYQKFVEKSKKIIQFLREANKSQYDAIKSKPNKNVKRIPQIQQQKELQQEQINMEKISKISEFTLNSSKQKSKIKNQDDQQKNQFFLTKLPGIEIKSQSNPMIKQSKTTSNLPVIYEGAKQRDSKYKQIEQVQQDDNKRLIRIIKIQSQNKINQQKLTMKKFIQQIDDQKMTNLQENEIINQQLNSLMNKYQMDMKQFEPKRLLSLQYF